MKRSRLTLVALCALALLARAAGADSASGSEASPVYQFRGDRLATSGEVIEARVEYEVRGRTLHTEHLSFRVDVDGAVTFPVPDPARVAALARQPGAAEDIRLHVYAGDTLLDSFDPESFRAYNEHLRRTDPGLTEQFGPGASTAILEKPMAAPSDPEPENLTAATSECQTACRQEYFQCIRAGWSGCEQGYDWCLADCPDYDSDGDGVLNGNDNCVFTPNPNQANCDGDGSGDACDGVNATYQTVIPEQTCMTDKDLHFSYFTFEHHVEWLERDTSSCGAPDRWRSRIRQDNDCVGISDKDCCWGLRHSIWAVGDDPVYWCSSGVRDINFCH